MDSDVVSLESGSIADQLLGTELEVAALASTDGQRDRYHHTCILSQHSSSSRHVVSIVHLINLTSGINDANLHLVSCEVARTVVLYSHIELSRNLIVDISREGALAITLKACDSQCAGMLNLHIGGSGLEGYAVVAVVNHYLGGVGLLHGRHIACQLEAL